MVPSPSFWVSCHRLYTHPMEARLGAPHGGALTLLGLSGIVSPMSEERTNSAGRTAPQSRWQLFGRWLQPGLGVKRWLALLVLGVGLLGLRFGLLLEGP